MHTKRRGNKRECVGGSRWGCHQLTAKALGHTVPQPLLSIASPHQTTAMLLYNLGAVVVLGAAGTWSQTAGIALRPAVIIHATMARWCVDMSFRC